MVRLCLFLIPIVPAVDTFLVSLVSRLCPCMSLRSLQLPINLSPANLTSSSSIFPLLYTLHSSFHQIVQFVNELHILP